jgi:23S rRNA (guanosine2251-2'-O)-methyltransferase
LREWIYGRNPVYEVMRAGRRQIFRLLIAQGIDIKGRLADIRELSLSKDIPVEQVPKANLDSIQSHNQGVLLEASDYPYSTLHDLLDLAVQRQQPPLILILDTLKDPQNLGTLMRTSEVVGVHGVLLPYRRTATVTPAVVNASSGASEHLLIIQINLAQAINSIKEKGIWVIGLESGPESQPLENVDLRGPLAVVVGSEGGGMRKLVRKSCDQILQLPMRGRIESLNAAVAGSVALYLAWGARGYPTGSMQPE